jgi:orotidine 5'-phosphate decarboxylase subfamily 1
MLRYEQRAPLCQNPTAKKLLTLMAEKQTNLAVSLDVTTKAALLDQANRLGPEICILKTHIDILEDFDGDTVERLMALAQKHRFLIFDDRKFADIGNTVRLQYEKGIYHIAQWATITNAHSVSGPGVIEGLKQVGLPLGNGLLLLAQMSSQGSLATGSYTDETIQMALAHPDFVIGFITQHQLVPEPTLINLTPGVQMTHKGDDLGQQYHTPYQAVYENGADVIIVGRGIYQAANPDIAAQDYRRAGWDAYLRRLSK